MTQDPTQLDPSGVIAEAYRMEGLVLADCRSIFLEWLIGVPDGRDPAEAAQALLTAHGAPDHPMTQVLREAVEGRAVARRRGGARGRR